MKLVDENGFEYVEIDAVNDTYVATGEPFICPCCTSCVNDVGCPVWRICGATTTGWRHYGENINRLYFQPKED